MERMPSNRHQAVEAVVCRDQRRQFGTMYDFPKMDCITGCCQQCDTHLLENIIKEYNEMLLRDNRRLSWHEWLIPNGKSTPEKCEVKGTVKLAVDQLLEKLCTLMPHLFRSSWHRNTFEYIRHDLNAGYVVQIFDFAQNFRNMYQDEVQSAYWAGTQTTIHAIINYFKCEHCPELVTLILAQISDDLLHDSFLARAGHDAAFKYLAEIGVGMT